LIANSVLFVMLHVSAFGVPYLSLSFHCHTAAKTRAQTCICVLQNEAAARRWPVSDAVESEMREAMLRGVPSAAAVARRLARARGAGEADGGGKKQYQGKRENKCGLLT
jgi:hypothetical protein